MKQENSKIWFAMSTLHCSASVRCLFPSGVSHEREGRGDLQTREFLLLWTLCRKPVLNVSMQVMANPPIASTRLDLVDRPNSTEKLNSAHLLRTLSTAIEPLKPAALLVAHKTAAPAKTSIMKHCSMLMPDQLMKAMDGVTCHFPGCCWSKCSAPQRGSAQM